MSRTQNKREAYKTRFQQKYGVDFLQWGKMSKEEKKEIRIKKGLLVIK